WLGGEVRVSSIVQGRRGHSLYRSLDASNPDYIRRFLDLLGEFAAECMALYVENWLSTNSTPNSKAALESMLVKGLVGGSANPDLRRIRSGQDIRANPSFDMLNCLKFDREVKEFVFGTESTAADTLLVHIRSARNCISHGKTTGVDGERYRNAESGVKVLVSDFKGLIGLVSTSRSDLAELAKRSVSVVNSLDSTFHDSRVVRRVSRDMGFIRQDEDCVGMAQEVLDSVAQSVRHRGTRDPSLARLVLATLGAQVPSGVRVPGLVQRIHQLVPGSKYAPAISDEIVGMVKEAPHRRFELYTVAINSVCKGGDGRMIGEVVHRVVGSDHTRQQELRNRLSDRKGYLYAKSKRDPAAGAQIKLFESIVLPEPEVKKTQGYVYMSPNINSGRPPRSFTPMRPAKRVPTRGGGSVSTHPTPSAPAPLEHDAYSSPSSSTATQDDVLLGMVLSACDTATDKAQSLSLYSGTNPVYSLVDIGAVLGKDPAFQAIKARHGSLSSMLGDSMYQGVFKVHWDTSRQCKVGYLEVLPQEQQ
ncbi:hypothetical protein KIPB_006189, partial [Kipferlia bialata]